MTQEPKGVYAMRAALPYYGIGAIGLDHSPHGHQNPAEHQRIVLEIDKRTTKNKTIKNHIVINFFDSWCRI